MKTFILLSLLISAAAAFGPSSAFACRPMGVSCPEKTMFFDKTKISTLEGKVASYQRLLDKFIVTPDRVTSCFNNHFANFYISNLQEEMKKNEKVCENYREAISNAVNGLINPETDENKAVPEKYRGELKKLREEIKAELKDF